MWSLRLCINDNATIRESRPFATINIHKEVNDDDATGIRFSIFGLVIFGIDRNDNESTVNFHLKYLTKMGNARGHIGNGMMKNICTFPCAQRARDIEPNGSKVFSMPSMASFIIKMIRARFPAAIMRHGKSMIIHIPLIRGSTWMRIFVALTRCR